MNTSSLRPVGKLFQDSWAAYTHGIAKYAQIILIGLVPLLLAQIAHVVGLDIISGILIFVAAIAIYFASLSLVYAIADQGVMSTESYFRRGIHKAIPYLWTEFLGGIIILIGILLLIIPGIMWAVSYSLACYVVLFEGMSGMTALRQSKSYVKGHWWGVFGRYVALMIPLAIFSIIISLVGDTPSRIISLFTVTPFSMIYAYFMYQDLKAAKSVHVPPQEQVVHPSAE
jgi:hypothetical protein